MSPGANATRRVQAGPVPIGGGAPVSVQSMLTRPVEELQQALDQVERLKLAGCEIVRAAVPGRKTVAALSRFVAASPLPVVADVHYDARIALDAVREAGVQKVRINPGNIHNPEVLPDLARAASERGVPIRVGLNSGSVSPREHGRPTERRPEALLADAALAAVGKMEEMDFRDIVVSAKSPDVRTTIDVYRRLHGEMPYPLHLGVTAAGSLRSATVRHAAAFSVLLLEGIGDTVRVSIAGDPVDEVRAAWQILRVLGIRQRGAEVIACPTCGRTRVDLAACVAEVEAALDSLHARVGEDGWPENIRRVAVMGCEVNGPGEAAGCDIGIAFSGSGAVLFCKGEVVEKMKAGNAVEALLHRIISAAEGDQ